MVFSDTTKIGESREVPLPRVLADDLAAQAAGKRRDELLFEGPRGGALRAQTFQRAALTRVAIDMSLASPELDERGRQVMNADGVPQWTDVFHPHELRHTAASLAIHAGGQREVGADDVRAQVGNVDVGPLRAPVSGFAG